MLRYNPDKVTTLISELNESLKRLKQLSKLEKKQFLGDLDKTASAKYHFVIAIEAAIDVANHLIAKNNFRAPVDYADTFKVLNENDLLPENFTNQLQNMTRFRNRLIHLYWKVSDEMVYDLLKERLADLKEYVKRISNALAL